MPLQSEALFKKMGDLLPKVGEPIVKKVGAVYLFELREKKGGDRDQHDHVKNESERYGLKMMGIKKEENKEEPVEKEGINLGLSGALTADVNTFNGVVIKYSEPPEARLPKRRWRFYVFKGEEVLPTLHLHRQSAYLIGRDRKVSTNYICLI